MQPDVPYRVVSGKRRVDRKRSAPHQQPDLLQSLLLLLLLQRRRGSGRNERRVISGVVTPVQHWALPDLRWAFLTFHTFNTSIAKGHQ